MTTQNSNTGAARLRLRNRRNPLARSSSKLLAEYAGPGGAPQARRPRSPSGLRARRPSWLRPRDLAPVRRARLARARRARIMRGDWRENGRRRGARRGDRPARVSFAVRRYAGRQLRAAVRRDAGGRAVARSDRERFDLVARPHWSARIMGARPTGVTAVARGELGLARRRARTSSRRVQGRRFSGRRAKRGTVSLSWSSTSMRRSVLKARSHPRSVARSRSPDATGVVAREDDVVASALGGLGALQQSVAQRPHVDLRRSGGCQRMAPPNYGRIRQSAKAVRQNDRLFSGRQTSARRRDDGRSISPVRIFTTRPARSTRGEQTSRCRRAWRRAPPAMRQRSCRGERCNCTAESDSPGTAMCNSSSSETSTTRRCTATAFINVRNWPTSSSGPFRGSAERRHDASELRGSTLPSWRK